MEKLLLAAHVLAGILFVGPVAVTASLFPRYAPLAAGSGDPGLRDAGVAAVLHRVTRSYGVIALVVPLIGLLLAGVQGRVGEIWITVAMVLTAVAGGLLALRIAPTQREALDSPDDGSRLRTLGAMTGVFNLLWAAVVVLMVVRPGAS
ncbi:hypothetical protein [Auraticoccus monumenti]|uniref:Integral membrane protein n=1 Tax=Auraticoccus monumenti TaxID=675864 RepID=A0A1G7EA73_9ACTN|nr:hypothetical protein [Auraticoccus monumenti]SDE60572.1 hypothetical protein SAMN04489747_3879 [Auraticoccus monumenti]